ncbi:uncharacterized protein LOC130134985 [Syzygium oleosum]|uniref:uncharacterized protein LOC130134985 n=1 Tax=Syzygium oleosum TaxID=219896 RepID=UPI0024BB884A|nr:uncharacterized protein LOC130134985 [Syzygium oleosum]
MDCIKCFRCFEVVNRRRLGRDTPYKAAKLYLRAVPIPHSWHHSVCIGDHSIGYVSVKPGSGDEWCRIRVGYAIGVEFWGWGFATAALRMAAHSVFDKMPELVRLEASV